MLISIDHGNKQMKTIHHAPFTSGLQESDVLPFGGETIKYQERYYTLSEKRIPYHRDKAADERFWILSLFAIAYEIEAKGAYSTNIIRVQLAVGLPPAHFGAQYEGFTNYFSHRGVVQFEYQKKPYSIYIEKVMCFPQSYAAAVTVLKSIRNSPKSLIIDLGGYTADYLQLQNGVADLSVCDSLENGVILLYNKIKSKVSAELDILLEEVEIDAILAGQMYHVPDIVVEIVEQQAQNFINELFNTLRERSLELRSGIVVFVGGGAIRLRKQIEASGKIGKALFVDDVCANAKGFKMLYQFAQDGR